MTPTDDLKPGMFVAVTAGADRYTPPWCDHLPTPYNGRPFRVLAVSLPFIALEDCATGDRQGVDVRAWQFQKVTRQYVKALTGRKSSRTNLGNPKLDDPNACPRCGERTRERVTAGRGGWRRACVMCGWEGEA